MRYFLRFPFVYRLYQKLILGNKTSFPEYLASFLSQHYFDHTIVDLGCGDAIIASFLDSETRYIGIDHNPRYIEKARSLYPNFKFHLGNLSELELIPQKQSIFLLIGVVHHLSDEEVISLISKIKQENTNPVIICWDGLRLPKQNFIARLLNDFDRGKYVRYLEGYKKILTDFDFIVRDDLLAMPFDSVISTFNLSNNDLNQFFIDRLNKKRNLLV